MDQCSRILALYKFGIPSRIGITDWHPGLSFRATVSSLSKANRPFPPLELKILAVLRVLGRGYCFDGIWWSYWLDEGRRYRLLDPPRVSGYLDGWLVVTVLGKTQI